MVPVFFRSHEYAGTLDSYTIFEVPDNNFGVVRATIINGKCYYCAIDMCKALELSSDQMSDIIESLDNCIDKSIVKSASYDSAYYLYDNNNNKFLFVDDKVLRMMIYSSDSELAKKCVMEEILADYNQTQNNKEQYNYQQQSEVNID